MFVAEHQVLHNTHCTTDSVAEIPPEQVQIKLKNDQNNLNFYIHNLDRIVHRVIVMDGLKSDHSDKRYGSLYQTN